jgi:hypothetical protein
MLRILPRLLACKHFNLKTRLNPVLIVIKLVMQLLWSQESASSSDNTENVLSFNNYHTCFTLIPVKATRAVTSEVCTMVIASPSMLTG